MWENSENFTYETGASEAYADFRQEVGSASEQK